MICKPAEGYLANNYISGSQFWAAVSNRLVCMDGTQQMTCDNNNTTIITAGK